MSATVFLLYDPNAEGESATHLFRDAVKAAATAEEKKLFARAVLDVEGELEDVPAFWQASMRLDTGKIATGRTARYLFGSEAEPCRHGKSFAGRVVWQDLDTITAWGATEEQAVERCKKNALEGRKRAARDKAWDDALQPELEEVRKTGGWDPYGFWIPKDVREKATAASEAAYQATT